MIPQIEEVNFPPYATLHQATVSLQEMGERTISTQVRIDGDIAPEYGVTRNDVFYPMELVFKGERFILPIREPQAQKDNTTLNSLSDLTFYSWPIYQLKRYFFFSYDPQNTSTAVAEQYNASVKLDLTNFGVLFNRVLNYYFNGDIVMDINPAKTTEAVFLEINYSYLWDVLLKVYETYGARWFIERNPSSGVYVIKVGYADREVDGHVFEYGYQGGLLKFERQVQDPEIYNILLGRGGEKNLPYRYFKQELTEDGTTWRGDPDAIPELANIYFDRLRDVNFRWYIRGWAKNSHRDTSHDSGYTLPDYDDADVPEAYLWAYRKGRYEDTTFNPVEYVKDDESIAKYGELWGAMDDLDDVFPTIQGRYGDGIGRVDESVAFSEIVTDDIQAVSQSAAMEASIPDVKIYPQSRMAIAEQSTDFDTFVVVTNPFTIPQGKTANITFSPFGVDERYPGEIAIDTSRTYGKAVSHNTGIADIEGSSEAIAAVPAGTWHLEFTIVFSGIDVSQGKTAAGVFGFNNIRVLMSYIDAGAWKPTFDIWVKNIWGTQKSATETEQEYAERVWLPILGDRWGKDAKIVFSDGNLSVSEDYEFVITSIPVYDTSMSITTTDAQGNTITVPSHWRITLRKSDAELEALGVYIPSAQPQQQPSAGDHFYFIGIDIPHAYVEWAEEQLNGTAFTPHINKRAFLDGQADINPSWVVTLDKVRAHTVESDDLGTALVDRLFTGALLSARDSRFTGGETIKLYITSLTYAWNEPSESGPNIVPEIEIVLSDKIVSATSAFSKLQGDVSYIQRSYATNEDIEAVVRRIASEFFLKKNGEPDASSSPTSFASKVASADFSQGQMTGRGWGLYRSNAPEIASANASDEQDAILELDILRVRKSLEVNEIVANQTTHVGGRRIQSAASIICSQVVEDESGIICYFDQKQDSVRNLFVVDDIALMQTYDAENTLVRYCKRRVIEIGENYVTLSTTDVDGSGVPQEGDILVQYGNYTNPSRRYVIIQDVIGGGYEQMIYGLSSVSTVGTEYYFGGYSEDDGSPRWFVGNRANKQYIEYTNGHLTIMGSASVSGVSGSTEIAGNLVQTGEISLGQVSNNTLTIYSGISGFYDANARGGGVAAWYGGPKVDHEVDASATTYARSLFRFDGSGYLASGNIKWDAAGAGSIPGISWNGNSIIIDSEVKFRNINDNLVGLVDSVKTLTNMFVLEGSGTTADPYRIKALHGLYSDSFISAGGLNSESSGGGGGASSLSELNDVRLSTLSSGQMLIYNGSYWVNSAVPSGGVQSDWSETDSTSPAYIKHKPTIPSAPGTLITNLSTAQTVSEGESLSGTIRLHKVAKTGAYSDLRGTPDLSVYVVNSDLLNYIGKVTSATANNVAVFAGGGGLADSGIAKSGLALLAGDQTFTGNNIFSNTVRANGVILDGHITPSGDRAYNLGANDGYFKEGHIEDIYVKSFIPWKQQGATIPGDSNPASGGYNFYTIDANGRWNNGLALTPSEAIVGSQLRPASDGALSLGLADYRWGNLFARYIKATDSLEAGSIYAYNNATAFDFYIGNGSGGWLKALQLNNTQIEVNRHVVPNANQTYDLGANSLRWRYLFANRWYPNGANGPYIEYDSAKTSFKVNGNMYVTGFLTAGASGQNDVQSSISYSLVPTQSGAYNLGSDGYKFGTLYANTVRATSIYTTDLTVTNLNYVNWVTWGSEDNSFLDLLDGSTHSNMAFSTYGIDTSVFADIISGKIVTIRFYDNEEDIMHITEAHLSGDGYITIYFGRKFRLVQTSATRFTIYGTLN